MALLIHVRFNGSPVFRRGRQLLPRILPDGSAPISGECRVGLAVTLSKRGAKAGMVDPWSHKHKEYEEMRGDPTGRNSRQGGSRAGRCAKHYINIGKAGA